MIVANSHHIELNTFYKSLRNKARAKSSDSMYVAYQRTKQQPSLHNSCSNSPSPITVKDTSPSIWDNRTSHNYSVNTQLSQHDKSSSQVVIAAARILPYQDFHVLRNVLVTPQHRNQGVAYQFLREALDLYWQQQSSPDKSRMLYAIPTSIAMRLYQKLGFHAVADEQIPEPLQKIYRKHCRKHPDTKVMALML